MIKYLDLTIVIPTLGESSLKKCINSVYRSTYRPKIIFIIIPKKYSHRINSNYTNSKEIRVVYTNFKGQVKQRIYGFKLCSTKYVMQLDSDIILETNTIELLYKCKLRLSFNTAIAPFLKENKIYNKKKVSVFENLKNYILNKKYYLKPGKITDIGYSTWFKDDRLISKIYRVEWLPGGCILYNKVNLVKKDYFPFEGKAYCEDIFHSIILRNKNINLIFFPKSIAHNIGETKVKFSFKNKIDEFKVRFHLLKKINGSFFRFIIWYSTYMFK